MSIERRRGQEFMRVISYTMTGLAPKATEALRLTNNLAAAAAQQDPCPATNDMVWRMKTATLGEGVAIAAEIEARKIPLKERMEVGAAEKIDTARKKGAETILAVAWGVEPERLREIEHAVEIVGRAMTAGVWTGTTTFTDGGSVANYAPGLRQGEDLESAVTLLRSLGVEEGLPKSESCVETPVRQEAPDPKESKKP